jgi:hypothetical protein
MMDKKQSILYFLYSTPNIVGSILGICGLAFNFVMLALGAVFWWLILIVPALYLIGLLITPESPTYELQFRTGATADEIQAELAGLVKTIRGKVSEDILKKVESITTSILDILPRIVDINSADHNIYIIRQTALEYLPETLENYLNLPKAYANFHPVKDNKTAKQLLFEQLDLLDQQMQEIVEDFHRDDAQRLLAHGRFLEKKFNKSDLLAGV